MLHRLVLRTPAHTLELSRPGQGELMLLIQLVASPRFGALNRGSANVRMKGLRVPA